MTVYVRHRQAHNKDWNVLVDLNISLYTVGVIVYIEKYVSKSSKVASLM